MFIVLAAVLALAVNTVPTSADSPEAKLIASDATVDDYFGCSVSVSGDIAEDGGLDC